MADEFTALDAAKGLGGVLVAMFSWHYKSLWSRVSALETKQAELTLALSKQPTKDDLNTAVGDLKEYIGLAMREDPAFYRKKFRDLQQGFVGEFKDED